MFEYKSEAQLKAMSEAERDTYAAEKRKHETELQKQAIIEATKELKTDLTTAQKAEIQSQIEALKLSPGITKEQFDELKEDLRIIKENPTAVKGQGFDMMAAIEEGLKTFLPQVKEKAQASGRNGFGNDG